MKFLFSGKWTLCGTLVFSIILVMRVGLVRSAYAESSTTNVREGRAQSGRGSLFGRNWNLTPSGRCKKTFAVTVLT